MGFAAPLWLVGIIPWSVLTVWLLSGFHERREVPFLHLWPTEVPRPRSQRAWRRPPISLILLLAAMLLAILGAAGPHLTRAQFGRVTVIVDRDVIMSARSGDLNRLHRLMEINAEKLNAHPTDGWISVPPSSTGQVSSLRTLPMLRQTVRQALDTTDHPIVVLGGQALGIDDRRVIQMSLPQPIENVGIVRLGAREHPSAQMMVRVRNQSPLDHAELVVSSDGKTVQRPIDLPPSGAEMDYFIDLSPAARVLSVQLVVDDELPADNYAWLVRQRMHPTIEMRGILPQSMSRMIDVYRKLRPSGDGSARIAVVDSLDRAPATDACSILEVDPDESIPRDQAVLVEAHAVTQDVDWKAVLSEARVGAVPTGEWEALVRVGHRTVVAVRHRPVRQLWVGFDSDAWGRSSDFVIFWTNVFDWLGAGAEQFTGEPIRQVGDEWVRSDELSGGGPPGLDPAPGVYLRSDGAIRGLSVLDIHPAPPPQSDWDQRISAHARSARASGSFSAATLLAALGCALFAALTWGSGARRIGPT